MTHARVGRNAGKPGWITVFDSEFDKIGFETGEAISPLGFEI